MAQFSTASVIYPVPLCQPAAVVFSAVGEQKTSLADLGRQGCRLHKQEDRVGDSGKPDRGIAGLRWIAQQLPVTFGRESGGVTLIPGHYCRGRGSFKARSPIL